LRQEDIIEFLKQKVAKYAVPKGVFFIDNMPLTKLQKVDKKTLRELGIKLYYKDFINNDSKAF
jgi:acyl-CoA synthetase (AMP-forming)/AMP-acid ligase II